MTIQKEKSIGTLLAALILLLLVSTNASPLSYTLTTAPSPIEGGMISPNCSVGCIQGSGATVGLFALPYAGYLFGGWGGDCSGLNPATSVTINEDHNCTAGFTACSVKPIAIGTAGYDGLASAYAVAGEGSEIKILATNLPETPNLNRQVDVTIKGGYPCGFSASQSMTMIQGPLSISKGSVTVENLTIVGPLSAASGIPPAVPNLPEASGFVNVINHLAVSGDATQDATGTTGSDRITQYGGTGAVVQTATGDAGNDWILQVCGGTSCEQTVNSGEGIDTVYQYGGPGSTSQFINGTGGDKTYIQVGGASPNTQIAFGSTGFDRISQYGGASADLMNAEGAAGEDLIEQYGQGGDDTMVVGAGSENDYIFQDGGAGNNTLSATGDFGEDRIIQKGGTGNDSIGVLGGDGNDFILIDAGAGNDFVDVNGGIDTNSIAINAGPGSDTIWYWIRDFDEYRQIDSTEIDGGEGVDTMTIRHYYAQNPVYRIVDGSGSTIYETGSGGSVITVRNLEFLIDYGDAGDNFNDNVTFTLTFSSGSLFSQPAGADRITISLDGTPDTLIYRLSPEMGSAANPLRIAFLALPGDHTYTAKAWSGSTLLDTIGPISFTTVSGFPLTIPLAFSFPAFDSYHTDIGEATPNTFTFFGTEGRERVVQYGGAAGDTLFVESGAGNDWVEQYGGAGDDGMLGESGTENDYIMQVGGDGKDNLKFHLGFGDDSGFQYGGAGDDNIEALGGDGSDTIYIEGGEGNDTIFSKPDAQNDIVAINAGAGNDALTYEVCSGTDSAFIDGGTGPDTLTLKENGQPFVLKDSSGNTLYDYGSGGTVITVANLEQITVLDTGGNVIFTWSAP